MWEAIQASKDVAASTEWTLWKGLPGHEGLFAHLREKIDWAAVPVTQGAGNKGDAAAALAGAAKLHSATYQFPYLKHAPIGPAVAVGDVQADGTVTVHTNTQNPQYLRKGIATMLNTSIENVVIRTYPGLATTGDRTAAMPAPKTRPFCCRRPSDAPFACSGCGRKICSGRRRGRRCTRRFASVSTATAGLSATRAITSGRPCRTIVSSGRCSPVCPPSTPRQPPCRRLTRRSCSSGITGSTTRYRTSPKSGTARCRSASSASPLHTGLRDHSMRTPIQFQQNFPREVAMTEAAALARLDALQFRIDQTNEPRLKDILTRLREASEWQSRPSPAPDAASGGDRLVRGRGLSVIFRDNGFWACAAHVAVTPSTGAVKVERITLVVDPGIVVNPLQLRRQVEAGCLMGVSIALHEEVPFDEGAITAKDWLTYPILKMAEMPEIKVVLVDRPETGVYGQGSETANALAGSAIANGVFDATGKPVRRLPLRPDLVKRALSA